MATHLNIPPKIEGSKLTAPEFNAVVTAINENGTSLESAYDEIQRKLGKTTIVIDSQTSFIIDSIESLIEYLHKYGTATPYYNTAPLIKINKTTYVYKAGQRLDLELELFDSEGGFLTLTGSNPTVPGGYNTFSIEGLRSGFNTINFNEFVFNNTTSRLDVGTYIFSDIYVTDALGRSSLTPLNLKIIIGSIELVSGFDSTVAYEKNKSISVRYGVSSITNSLKMTYRISGKMLIDDGSGNLSYQPYTEVVDTNEEFKVTSNDADFVTGDVYYHNYVIPEPFSQIGDYNLTIVADGLGDGEGVSSNTLTINIVVNEPGVLYSSSLFDSNGTYYAGDSIDIPVNIYYNETPDTDYTYQSIAWIEGLNITGSSNVVSEQKNIPLRLTLPDDPDLYTILYRSQIITPSGEVYKTNTNYIALQAKPKSIYNVVTDSSSKLELYLTAKGKTNASPNWQVWENRYNLDQQYYGDLIEFSKLVNGWELRKNNNQHTGDALYASGTSYCLINYKPFDGFDLKGTGLTLDFSIRHGDLISPNNYNLSIGRPSDYPQTGVYVFNNTLQIRGLNSPISVPIICDKKVLTKLGEWEDGDEYAHITITYNFQDKEVFVYLNGVISSYGTFSNASTIAHSYPIVFNGAIDATNRVSGIADSKMRFIRVYKTCLTHEQVLGNYIASYPDDSERLLLEGLNDQVNPILSTSYLKGDRVGIIKDEMRRLFFSFVPGNEQVIADTYIPNPIAIGAYGQQYMDMKEEMPVDVDLQGNSSLSYPVKNYGIDIYDAEAWNNFRIAESKEYNMVYNKDKLPEYRPWANWDSYHLKANYIDSSHCNNLIMAKLSEQIFRLPYNWQDITDYFPTTTPFKNFTVVRPDGVIDPYSRFPVYPVRLAVDGFPFVLKGDYVNTNGKTFEKEFIGVYTWNMKQHRKLYALPSMSTEPNKRSFIYRCESNGDSVHEQLRSGYSKFIDMKSQELLLDSYERVITRQYIASQEDKQMFAKYQKTDYTYYPIGETTGYLQTYNNKYTWIKYGIGSNGQDMSDSNISKTHIGIAIDKDTSVKSSNALDYTWHSIDIYEGIPNESGTFTLVQYAANANGDDLSGSSTNKFFIAFKYNAVKDYWVEGVHYFNKTGDPQEMQWRPGAELIMDWECREPDDLGNGHWEEFKNGQWVTTYDIIDAKDLDRNATEPDKVLRFVWDNINSNGDAKRSGNATVDYYTSILDSNLRIPTLSDPNQTFAAINKNKAISATRYHVDFLNAITWMSNASDECFGDSKIFEKYFDLRNCIDYILSCLTFALTDSIGRNLTMIAWDQNSVKIAPGVMQREKMRFYPVFYDIDTAFGTNVQGGLYSTPYIAWPYDIGDLYKAAEGAGQEYNCFGTLFLKRISKCYAKQMARRYQELRSGTVDPLDSKTKLPAPFDYLNILQLYTKQMIGRIGERYFNEDAVYKYIGFDNDPDETAKRNYITNARGNKIMFMKNFLKKRLDYIDSLMGYVPDTDDMAYFQHYSSGQLTLTIRTMVAGYVRVSFAQNQIVSVYCDGINPVSVSYNYSTVTQHILRIYNCGIITHLAGLANKDVRIARLNSMINLMILDLRGNPNFGTEVSTLEISECKNLRTIDLTGCNGANEFTPDISGCIFLEEFLISNSSVGNVSFANNLNIKTIDVRNCPRFNTLDISNLYRLTSLNYDEHRLVSLNISNSAYSIDFSQPNIYNNLLALSIVNNRAITNLSFGEGSFQKLQQLTISDCSKLVSVVGLFKNRTGYPSLNTDFLARCPLLQNVDNLFENSVIEVIPSQMFLDSTGIKTMIGLFKDCKNIKTIPVNIFDSLPNIEDITDIFNGASLQYYTDITDFDEYGSEYVVGKQWHNVFRSDNIFSNCPKLKFATRAFANSELINVPKNIFANSPILQNIEYCFSGILNLNSYYEGVGSPLVFPNTLWITAPLFMSIKGVFKDTFINQIHDNIFSSCPKLTNASELFYGSTLTNIPTQIFSVQAPLLSDLSYAFASTGFSSIYENFLNNFPNLSNIQNIFYGSNITSLPSGFLVNNKITSFKFSDLGIPLLLNVNSDILSQNTVLTSIQNLFSNTQILNSPNNLFSNNSNISNITGFLDNSNIDTIGENFLLTNKVEDISNLFKDKTGKIIQLGTGFMQNSLMLKQANSVFENCTSIISTPSNMLSNCPELLSASKFFYNASNLSNINSGFLKNAPKLQIISDIFRGTAISQIKDDILLNPNISIFKFSDILNHKVTISVNFLKDSTISNIDNLFTDTLIEQIPSNFFSTHSIVNPLQMFYNSSIKTIGDNCFSSVSIEDASDMFQNCPIVSIGSNFMQNSLVKYMNNMFRLSTTINSIGDNFMGDKALVESASGVFQTSTIQTIGNGFLNNSPLLTNVQNIFDGCTLLVALPTDFIKNSPLISSLSGVFSNNGIKTISNNFCEGNTGITTLNGIFSNSNIESIGDYFFKNSTGIVSIANMFLNNQKIKNIGNFFFDGSALTNVSSAFKGSSIQTIGQNIFNGCQIQNASSLLENATKLATIGQNFFNNMPALVNIQNIFKGAQISQIPTDFIKLSPLVNSLVGVFDNNIINIPNGFCPNNTGITSMTSVFTNSNIQNIGNNFMNGCTSLVTIKDLFLNNNNITNVGSNFYANSSVTNVSGAFKGSSIIEVGDNIFASSSITDASSLFEGSQITNIGLNFLSSNPQLVNIQNIFKNCVNIVELPNGFIANSPLVNSLVGVFAGNGITSIPDNFCKLNTGLLNLDNVFVDKTTFESVANVTNIGQYFCANTTMLTNVSDAFRNYDKLESIGSNLFANGVVSIANRIFQDISSLSIGENSFVGCPLTSVNSMFKNSGNIQITGTFLNNFPNLIDIRYIFNNSLIETLPTGFIENSKLINSLTGVFDGSSITVIPSYFCEYNTGITSLSGVFANSNIEVIESHFFDHSNLTSIDNLFLNNTKIQTIQDSFCSDAKVSTAVGAFKNSSVKSIDVGFCRNCPLTSAESMLEGSQIQTIGDGFLGNFQDLVNIQNIFKSTQISQLPIDFIKYSTKVNSLIGVFAYNNITSIPNDFCVGNTGITTLVGAFTGSSVSSIGDNFMSNSTGLTSINNAFVGNNSIQAIGKLFMANSGILTADYAFQNVTSLNKVGSGMFQGCQLNSVISMFDGCSNLNQIGEYIEWYDPADHASYLYVKDPDVTKCNTAGQQAEVNLFVSVPYLDSENDSFTGLSDLTKMANIFKGTGLVRTPKGFLKNSIYTSELDVLSTILGGSNIKFFNPDLFGGAIITSVTTLFDNTQIIAIPTGFMSNYAVGTQVEIQWINKKSIQKVAYIPNTFLRNCNLWVPGNNDGYYYFESTSIRMLQNDWLDWPNTTKYSSGGDGVQFTPGFNYSELVNLPRGYMKCSVIHNWFNRNTLLYANKMDTIIPEFAFSSYIGPYSETKSPRIICETYFPCFYAGSIKGVVPKTFLNYNFKVNADGLRNLFQSQNIVGVENGCFEKNISTDNSYLIFNGIFNDCTKLQYIPPTFLSGYDTQKTINFSLTFRNCVLLKTFPDMLRTIQNVTGTNGMFYGCTGITNSDGSLDEMIVNLTNQSQLVDANEMFRGCTGLVRLPDNTFSNCPLVTKIFRAFWGCTSLGNLPANILYNNTQPCDIEAIFQNCSSLQSIPTDFMRYAKISHCAHAFNGCSNLSGVIPSNFLLASNAIVTHLYYTFYNCAKITGFENNTWNVTDFSNLLEVQYMFSGCGITTIPSTFCNKTFAKLTRCDEMFSRAKIDSIPSNFLNNCPLLTRVDGSFNSTLITSMPIGLYENCPKVTNANYVFSNCSYLTGTVPVSFLRNSILITGCNYVFNRTKINRLEVGNVFERLTSASSSIDFKYMFFDCQNFTGKLPEFWTLYPSVTATNKNATFAVCYNAENWYKVPVSWGGTLQRSFLVLNNSTQLPISGANIQIGSNNYTTDARGVVSISGGSAVTSATVSAVGYKTVVTGSYPSISDTTYHTINLMPIQIVTFQVKTTDGLSIPNATVVCDGQTVSTNSIGQAQVSVIAGTYSYTVSYESKTATGSVVVSQNMTQNVVLSLLAYEVVPSENNNIQILTKGTTTQFVVYSSDSAYTIEWGDGTITNATGNGSQTYNHTYSNTNYYLANISNCQNVTSCMTGTVAQLICYWSVGNSKISGLNFENYTALKQVGSYIFKNDSTKTNFYGEFKGCTSLMKIPVGLFDPCVSAQYVTEVFYGCTALTSIPEDLFKYNNNVYALGGVFYNCTNITSIPEKLFQINRYGLSLTDIFYGCTKITSIPQNLFNYNTSITNITGMFAGTSITSIPVDLFKNLTGLTMARYVFRVSKITSIPQDIFRYNTSLSDVQSIFAGCTSLTSIPSGVFAYNSNITTLRESFYACSNVTSAVPALWSQANLTKLTDYSQCFGECTNASNYASIPATWK